jgi:hypothetical protein
VKIAAIFSPVGRVCKVNFVKSFYENRYLAGKERRSLEVIFTISKIIDFVVCRHVLKQCAAAPYPIAFGGNAS